MGIRAGNKLGIQRKWAKIDDLTNNSLDTNCITLKRGEFKYREFIK
jgi:hypothetical protein